MRFHTAITGLLLILWHNHNDNNSEIRNGVTAFTFHHHHTTTPTTKNSARQLPIQTPFTTKSPQTWNIVSLNYAHISSSSSSTSRAVASPSLGSLPTIVTTRRQRFTEVEGDDERRAQVVLQNRKLSSSPLFMSSEQNDQNLGPGGQIMSILKRIWDMTFGRVLKAYAIILGGLVVRLRSILGKSKEEPKTEATGETEDEDNTVSDDDNGGVVLQEPAEVEIAPATTTSTIELETPEMIEDARIVSPDATVEDKVMVDKEIVVESISEEKEAAIKEEEKAPVVAEKEDEIVTVIAESESKVEEVPEEPKDETEKKGVNGVEAVAPTASASFAATATATTSVASTPPMILDVNGSTATKETEQEENVAVAILDTEQDTSTFTTMSETTTDEVVVVEVEDPEITEPASSVVPKGSRWSIAAPGVDLSGKWKILVTDDFKKKYDKYLMNLGQPSIVRSVAISIVELTTEEINQLDGGREMIIKGTNLRGVWKRTLVASGSDLENSFSDEDELKESLLVTADKEKVKAIAWWDGEGTRHYSWLRGIKKYGGGDFESRRFLSDDGDKLICESVFHPKGEDKEKASITWTFKRVQ